MELWNGKRVDNKIKITFIHLIVGLWFGVLYLSTGHATDVTLAVGDGAGAPSSTDVTLEVSLINPDDPVRSIQMDVCDEGDYLSCTGCETTERTSNFFCSTEEQANGCCRIVFLDLGGGSITAGEGSVFDIQYDVSEEAPTDECKNLIPEEISIRDENKELLEATTESGEFCFSTPSTTTTTSTTTPSVDVLQNPMWKSRWIPIPYLMVIEGRRTNFVPFKTHLSFEPTFVIFPCFQIVWDSSYIWDVVLVMPGWLAGFDDQTVTVKATTDGEVADGYFEINLLPFILNNPNP